jgi:short-subunit dehydrogenase
VVETDVTIRSQVEKLKKQALKRFGRIDVWINNAGRGINVNVLEITDDDFEQMMASNVKSALYGMQVIVPYFKQQGQGHLINISSALARVPFATNRSIYSAAKAALNSLSASLRMELRKTYPNIHISVVMPPMVSTDFGKNALHSVPIPATAYQSGANIQTPEQTAAAIADVIDHPKAEVFTNPGQEQMLLKYFADIDSFEQNFGR